MGDFCSGVVDTVGGFCEDVYDSVKDNMEANIDAVEGVGYLVTGDFDKALKKEEDSVSKNLESGHEIAPVAEAVLPYTPFAWAVPIIIAGDKTYCELEHKPGGWSDMKFDSAANLCATTADAAGYSEVGTGIRVGAAAYDGYEAYEKGDTEGVIVNGAIAYANAEGGSDAGAYVKDIKAGKALYDAADGRGNAVDALAVAGGAVAGQTGHGDIATGLQVGRAGYDIADGRGGVHEFATIGGAAAGVAGQDKLATAIATGDKAYRAVEGHAGSSGGAGSAARIAQATGHGDLATGIGVGYGVYNALESFNRSSPTDDKEYVRYKANLPDNEEIIYG